MYDRVGDAAGREADDGIPKLTGNGSWPSRFSWHSTWFGVYLPAAAVFMHQRVSALPHTSKKVRQFTVPTRSHRLIVLYILFSLEVHFLYMRCSMTCLDYIEVLYCMYDCVRNGCLHIRVQTISINTSKYVTSEVLKGFFLPFSSVSNVLNLFVLFLFSFHVFD